MIPEPILEIHQNSIHVNGNGERNGYSPAYPIIPPMAGSTVVDVQGAKKEGEKDSWSGVKSLLTNFVGDFNKHIAETFGDQVVGFELSLAPEKETVVGGGETKVAEEKFVHHTVFCDRCLSVHLPLSHSKETEN